MSRLYQTCLISIRIDKCLSSDEDLWKQWIEDGVQNLIRSFQISGHAFWPIQCPGHLSKICPQNNGWKVRYLCRRIPGWYPDLYQRSRTTSRWGCTLGSGPTPEAFPLRQPEEMSFSSGWGSLLRIRGIVERNKHGSQKNWGRKRLAWTQISPRYSGFLSFCQFLLIIYSGFYYLLPMRYLPLMRLVALRVVMNRLRNVENCQKLKNCLSSKIHILQVLWRNITSFTSDTKIDFRFWSDFI